ncbi:MAG: DUF3604 domain-containing protein [Steroidobacteraceae bacterium]
MHPRINTLAAASGLLALAVTTAAPLHAQSTRESAALRPVPPAPPAEGHYTSSYPVSNRPFFGDTHLHTCASADAYDSGNRELTAADAFRFAMGEEVTAHNGLRVRLKQPLDFLIVTDHAEYLGGFPLLGRKDPRVLETTVGRRWAAIMDEGVPGKLIMEFGRNMTNPDPAYRLPQSVQTSIWREQIQTADRFYRPRRFTTFSGYEWSSTPQGNNLHRVVIFKDSADRVGRILPFSAQDSSDPEDLWASLRRYEEQTGGEVIAIPHNGNISNGQMFLPTTRSGKPFTRDYAERRVRWEPLVEVTQVKGDGEAHRSLSPSDEFADFERWDRMNISGTAPAEPWMFRYEYARSALAEGLRHEAALGVNPFRFGMIGSSDIHTSLSTVTEDRYFGKFPDSEPGPERVHNRMARVLQENWELGASGLAAVWAPENTREAIFAAFKRREVYGTTGSRILLRFFGGWDYAAGDVTRPDYADIGYAKGVPMGSVLVKGPAGKAPQFLVVAARDPDEANLDRVQVIKGWLDAQGGTHEKIYDVALSDGRKVDPKTGKAPPVGSTVDVKNATYTNAIGDPELATVWTDPDFDATQRAFYYVRVIEIPKPRWTAYDAKFFGTKMPEHVPMVVQDRAYSSPIWYEP